jgi:hypothetical protein
MRETEMIEKGLDPRSCYPRCDFCSAKLTDKKGNHQLGRWWAHARCSVDPDNIRLSSVKLPKLSYARFKNRKTPLEKLEAMQAYLGLKRAKVISAFVDIMKTRGNALLIPDTTMTEYE